MKLLINEIQSKIIKELSSRSSGVEEFIDLVENTDGLLRYLGFTSLKSLKDFIRDGDNNDLDELKKESQDFFAKEKEK